MPVVDLNTETVHRLAIILFSLVERYPGDTYQTIFKNAADFTGRAHLYWAGKLSNVDLVDMLERYYFSHD